MGYNRTASAPRLSVERCQDASVSDGLGLETSQVLPHIIYWKYKVYLGDITVCPFEETTAELLSLTLTLVFNVCTQFMGYLDSTACNLPLEVH